LGLAEAMGVAPRPERALDFGCGAGRLTQALAARFARCDGVDIAPSMIEVARRYNRFPDRCHYHLNTSSDLRDFADASFSFVYTVLVLQHMRPDYAKAYLREFLRVLAPGGLLVFQILGEPSPEPGATSGWRTPSLGPLGPLGFRARVLPEAVPEKVRPGERFEVRTTVQNAGSELWPALPGGEGRGEVVLGNHWLKRDGSITTMDDARAPLPRDLAPRDDLDVVIAPTAPAAPGEYFLELDMVQEGVSWFRPRGSPGMLVPILVSEAGASADAVEPPRTQPAAEAATGAPAEASPQPKRRESLPRLRAAYRGVRARAGRLLRPAPLPSPPEPPAAPAWAPIMEMNCVPRAEVFGLVAEAGARVVELERHCMPGFRSFRYWVVR
jgi:SAM-dependent methyltransferase